MPYKNPEDAVAHRKAYYLAHREEKLAYEKSKRLSDPVAHKERKRREYLRNRENYLNAAKKKWTSMEYWEQKFHNTMIKARKKASEIVNPDSIREFYKEIYSKDQQRCTYCHQMFHIYDIVIDHREPYALGGKHEVSNLVVCCNSCNFDKRAKPLEVWLANRN